MERGDTPYVEFGIHFVFGERSGKPACLPGNHTGNLSGETGGKIGTGTFQITRADSSDGRDNALFFLLSESDYCYFLQVFAFWFHLHFDVIPTFYRNLIGFVADKGEIEHIIGLYFQTELSIEVRHSSRMGAVDNDVRTR